MTKRSLTTWTIAGLISGWLFAEAVVIKRDAFEKSFGDQWFFRKQESTQ